MIRCLVSGTLHANPERRTSANGNDFAICKVKADDKQGAWVWVSAIAFGDAAERLLHLKAGDSVSISGRAEITGWLDKEGMPHGGLSLVADEVAALRAKPRPPQERVANQSHRPQPVARVAAPFDDFNEWQP